MRMLSPTFLPAALVALVAAPGAWAAAHEIERTFVNDTGRMLTLRPNPLYSSIDHLFVTVTDAAGAESLHSVDFKALGLPRIQVPAMAKATFRIERQQVSDMFIDAFDLIPDGPGVTKLDIASVFYRGTSKDGKKSVSLELIFDRAAAVEEEPTLAAVPDRVIDSASTIRLATKPRGCCTIL